MAELGSAELPHFLQGTFASGASYRHSLRHGAAFSPGAPEKDPHGHHRVRRGIANG